MGSVLIVSITENSIAYFTEILNAASYNHIVTTQSCGDARRLVMERDFDLVIINAPLQDETGERLSRYIASEGMTEVILVVRNEYFDAVSARCEGDGVLTIAKPINRAVFWAALKLGQATQNKLARIQAENNKLRQKIDDIHVIEQAKYKLISYRNMEEQQAHRYIEKQAMDMRLTKREVAEDILKKYSN